MSCEMTADGSRYLVRRSEMEALLSEREALAAHLERYRAAYVKLTNAECTQDADTGEYLRLVERKLMDEFDAIADETYTTSLARQKMLWQAEALESCAEKVAACSPGATPRGISIAIKMEAAELRRQAEDSP